MTAVKSPLREVLCGWSNTPHPAGGLLGVGDLAGRGVSVCHRKGGLLGGRSCRPKKVNDCSKISPLREVPCGWSNTSHPAGGLLGVGDLAGRGVYHPKGGLLGGWSGRPTQKCACQWSHSCCWRLRQRREIPRGLGSGIEVANRIPATPAGSSSRPTSEGAACMPEASN